MNRIHVISRGVTWIVKIEGGKGISKTLWEWREAMFWAAGRLLALGGGLLVVHNVDGTVKETWRIEKEESK